MDELLRKKLVENQKELEHVTQWPLAPLSPHIVAYIFIGRLLLEDGTG